MKSDKEIIENMIRGFEKVCCEQIFNNAFSAIITFLVEMHEDIDYEKYNTSLEEQAEKIKKMFILVSKKNAEIMSRNNTKH